MTDSKIDRVMRIRRRLAEMMYYDFMFTEALLGLEDANLEALEELIEKLEAK